ncbi:hypothetical protein [Sphingopyxis macrogoltabida]|uniref:Uncharacterized protein n=1 Tax=Sphingopyxis macrogoltabida TaxID=33050 RepID=A0AAC9AV16_SPHMC|nr:hypothetical protein [Sphingopyxis macrogoltabida]ALJ13236.1 hypothetical protein LH19_10190 [Sphingopyxis macrogoltabida]AMU89299.1 hypothetical protein ATM17_09645 [Sphingopyxis macrogoltabida]
MKRPNPLYAIFITLAVVVSLMLAIAVGLGEDEYACRNGRIAADILASPIDGNAILKSDEKIFPISAGYDGHQSIAKAASSSNFKFFYVPLRIKAACKFTMQAGKRRLFVEKIEDLTPISDIWTFDKIYTDFGIKPVKL